jgi:hypothetical protein
MIRQLEVHTLAKRGGGRDKARLTGSLKGRCGSSYPGAKPNQHILAGVIRDRAADWLAAKVGRCNSGVQM